MIDKKPSAFKTISEVANELLLIDKNTNKPKTHVIRFWEKKFKILKPSLVLKKHRYYSENDVEILKRIKFLLKDKGMTINGANKLIEKEYSIDYKKINNISSTAKLVKLKQIIKDIKKIL